MARIKRLQRWGKTAEIKHVSRVPGPEFKQLKNRLKHLAAWRRMHTLKPHSSVRMSGTRQGVRPSSNMTLRQKLRFIKKHSGSESPWRFWMKGGE